MLEVSRAVARRHQGRVDAGVGQGAGLERFRVRNGSTRGEFMPGQIQQRRTEVFSGGEALAPDRGGVDPVDYLRGQRLVRNVVPGKVRHHLRPEHPHLVDLGGVFHEVARHCGTGKVRIGDVGEQSVQRVAELVESGHHLVKGQQGGFSGGGLGNVQVVDHHRRFLQQTGLVDQGVHPGAAVLGVAGVVVTQEQAQPGAVPVLHLPDPDIGVVAGQVRTLGEGQPVQAVRGVEHAVLQHPLQFEVGAQGREVDVELFPPDLLRIEGPVPRRQFMSITPGRLAQQVRLGAGIADGGRRQLAEHVVDCIQGRSGLVIRGVCGMGFEAQQRCLLRAQRRHFGSDAECVGVIAAEAALQGRLVQPAAGLPVRQCGQRRLRCGQHQGEQVLAGMPGLVRRRGGGRHVIVGEPVELGGILHQQGGVVGVLEQPLGEARPELGEAGIELPHAGLPRIIEPGAGTHEAAQVLRDQAGLFRVQAAGLRCDRLHPGKERPVEVNGVFMGCQARTDFLFNALHAVGGVGCAERKEDDGGASQCLARNLQGGNGVLEIGCLRVRGDAFDLCGVRVHAGLEGREEHVLLDLPERGKLIRQATRVKERVVHKAQDWHSAASRTNMTLP